VIAASGLFIVLDCAIAIIGLRIVAASFSAGEDASLDESETTQPEATRRSILWRWLIPLSWIAVFAALGAAAIGYVALGSFIAGQMIRAYIILGSLYILLVLADEATLAAIRPTNRLSLMLTRSMGIARETVEQIAVILSGVTRLFLILLTTLFIMTP